MGMFSWECKGCGHELKREELTRINGHVGVYDGYGNNTTFNFRSHDGEAVCWHEYCYQNASKEMQEDNTKSVAAKDQGFGYPALEFMPGFEKKPTMYSVTVGTFVDGKFQNLFLVKDGWEYVLSDQSQYDSLMIEAVEDNFETSEWMEASTEEEREQYLEKKIGMKSPCREAFQFNFIQPAVDNAKSLLTAGSYVLTVLGTQGELQGAVYSESHDSEKGNTIIYEIGWNAAECKNLPSRIIPLTV